MDQPDKEAEELWQSFTEHCQKLSAFRANEDAATANSREQEIQLLRSVGTAAGDYTSYHRTLAYDAEQKIKQSKRAEEDSVMVRNLFESAFKLGKKLGKESKDDAVSSQPGSSSDIEIKGPQMGGIRNPLSAPAKDWRPGMEVHPLRSNPVDEATLQAIRAIHARASANAVVPASNSTANAPMDAGPPSKKHRPSQTAKVAEAPVKSGTSNASFGAPSNQPAPVNSPSVGSQIVAFNRPTTLTMAVLTDQDIVMTHPKKSKNYYVLICPICNRRFESAHGMYGHLSQSDAAHLDLFRGHEKTFTGAVEIGGIPVTDAIEAAVHAHNETSIRLLMAPIGRGPKPANQRGN